MYCGARVALRGKRLNDFLQHKEAVVKHTFWMAFTLGCSLGLAGCDVSVPHDAATPTTGSTPVAPASPPSVSAGAEAPHADVRANDGNVDVEVGPPGEKPGLDVDVRPGGNVDVNVDGEKIRERINERREERQEQRQATPPQ